MEYAVDVYGVVIKDLRVDEAATLQKRAELAQRKTYRTAYLTHFANHVGVSQQTRSLAWSIPRTRGASTEAGSGILG